MNHQELNRKLNATINEIVRLFEQQQVLAHSQMEDLFDLLSKRLLTKEEEISAIDQKIQEEEVQHQQFLKDAKETIESRFEVLQQQIQKFLSSRTLEGRKDQLQHKKDDELKDFRIAKKREKLDNNHKIAVLEKELNQKLKENEVRFLEEEKSHKQRVTELGRRLQLDLQRCADQNVDAYSDIEKNLLQINDVQAIKDAKEQIRKIRIDGIEQQAKLKKEHVQAVFEEEVSYERLRQKLILDDQIMKEEYRLRIEELKAEIYRLDYEQSHAETIRDFDNEEKLIDYVKENSLSVLQMKQTFGRFYEEMNNKILRTIVQLDIEKRSNVFDYIALVFDFDKEQLQYLDDNLQKINEAYKVQLKELGQSLISIVQIYKDFLSVLLWKQLEKKHHLRTQWLNTLLICSHNSVPLLDLSYRIFYDQLVKINVEYLKNSKLRFENYKKDFMVSIRLIIKQIDEMINSILSFHKEEELQENILLEQIAKHLMLSNVDAIHQYKQFDSSQKEKIIAAKKEYQAIIHAEFEEIASYENAYKEQYKTSMTDLQEKRVEYGKKGLSLMLPEIEKKVQQSILMHQKENKLTVAKIEKNLDKKKKEELQKIQKECTDRIKIL